MKASDDTIMTALLAHGSATAAARESGVSVGTVLKRLKNPVFLERYERARALVLESAVSEMKSSVSTAVYVLRSCMEDDNVNLTQRIQAADSLLRHTLRYVELAEIERRISALEKERETDEKYH